MSYTERRVVVIHNPESSSASLIDHDVFSPLGDKGAPYIRVATKYKLANDNIDDLSEIIREGDRLIVASGDGVTNQVANAAIKTDVRDIEIGALGFGGFNDIASTFTGTGALSRNPLPLLGREVPTKMVFPLSVTINDQHERCSVLYFASGFCALSSELMDDEVIRDKIKRTPRQFKQVYMATEAIKQYFKIKSSLPQLAPYERTTDQTTTTKSGNTDIVAINSPRIAHILRDKCKWYDGKHFRINELNARSLVASAPFLSRAACNNLAFSSFELPGEIATSVRFDFQTPIDLLWQVDGEVARSTDTSSLRIEKDPAVHLTFLAPHTLQK